jgi:hypothetical protein
VTSWENADIFVNIEETIDIKIAALRAHKSQMKDWDPEESIKRWAAGRAQGKEMAYAEGYRLVTLVDDETWAKTKGRVNGQVGKEAGETAAGEGASGEAPVAQAESEPEISESAPEAQSQA